MDNNQIEIIETLKEYVPSLYNGIIDVIEKIDSNKMAETLNVMSDIIEGIQWIVDASKVTFDSSMFSLDTESINTRLADILKCYEISDVILSRDILKYEILPILEGIYEIVEQL